MAHLNWVTTPGCDDRYAQRLLGGKAASRMSSAVEEASEVEHYAKCAQAYHTAFFYTGEYEAWQRRFVMEALGAASTDRVVDIGGGTGRFASLIHIDCALEHDVLCVDTSDDMLTEAKALEGVTTECTDAVTFSQRAVTYDRAMLKEIVHHIEPRGDAETMYKGIYKQLTAGGACVTITRPHEVEYPFFAGAHAVWREQQPPHEQFVAMMERAGFEVECRFHDYKASLSLEWWLDMTRQRFWSTFSHAHFDDASLEAGLAEVRAEYGSADGSPSEVHFTERIVVLIARKK